MFRASHAQASIGWNMESKDMRYCFLPSGKFILIIGAVKNSFSWHLITLFFVYFTFSMDLQVLGTWYYLKSAHGCTSELMFKVFIMFIAWNHSHSLNHNPNFHCKSKEHGVMTSNAATSWPAILFQVSRLVNLPSLLFISPPLWSSFQKQSNVSWSCWSQ